MEQLPRTGLNAPQFNSKQLNSNENATDDREIDSPSFMSDFAEATNDLLMAESAAERAAAAQRLVGLGRPLASPYLIAALSDQSWEVRQAAVEGLRDIGTADSISPLQELLARGNQDALLQRAIAEAIETITSRSPAIVEEPRPELTPVEPIVSSKPQSVAVEYKPDCIEAEARLRAEKERQLASEIEALHQAETEQARRIEEANARRNAELQTEQRNQRHPAEQETKRRQSLEVEALQNERKRLKSETLERANQEQQLLAEIERLRRSETEAVERVNALETTRQQREQSLQLAAAGASQAAEDHLKTLAELNALRETMTAAADNRTQTEHHLAKQIEALRLAEVEQLQRIAAATQSLHTHEQAIKQAEEKSQLASNRAQAAANQLTELQLSHEQTLTEAQVRTAEKQRLAVEIENLKKIANDQTVLLEEAKTRLTVLEEERARAETKVRQRSEREARLQSEIEALKQTGAEQTARILEAETEAQRLREEQALMMEAAESRRQSEAKARAAAAESEQKQLSEDLQRRAVEEEQAVKKLQTIRAKAEAAAERRNAQERELNAALEQLSYTAVAQLKRIQTAEASLRTAQTEAQRLAEQQTQFEVAAQQQANLVKELTTAIRTLKESENQYAQEIEALKIEAQQRLEQDEHRLAELESMRNHNAVAAQQRSDREEKLTAEIEALRAIEAEQSARLERLQSSLAGLQEQQQSNEATASQNAERQQSLTAEVETQQLAIATQVQQIAGYEEQVSRLEAQRNQLQEEAETRTQEERQLKAGLETLRCAEIEQRQRISQLETDLREAQRQALLLAEEQVRLRTEAQTLQQEQTRKRRADAEALRLLVENEAQQRAREELQQLEELEAIRSRIETETQRRVETAEELQAGIEVLRKAEALQLKRIAAAEIESQRLANDAEQRRLEHEARLQAESEAHQQALDEQIRAEESHAHEREQRELSFVNQVEELRTQAELSAQQRAERIEQLNAEIARLKQYESSQTETIRETEARLAEFQAACARLDEEAARVAAEDKSRRAAFATERQRRFEEALAATDVEERRIEDEQKQRNALLDQRQAELTAKAEAGRKRSAQLTAEIQALEKVQAEQRNRIQESEAALVARNAAIESDARQASVNATEFERQLADLQSQLAAAQAQVESNTATAAELKLAIEKQRKSQAKQTKELEKLEARRNQAEAEANKRATREAQLVAELESLMASIEQSENSWPETERHFKAQIEALRKAESMQARRFKKLVARLDAERQKLSAAAEVKGKTRGAKSAVKTAAKAKVAQPDYEERWVQILRAVRKETERELNDRSSEAQQLEAELQALLSAEVEQLTRVTETRAVLKERAELPATSEKVVTEDSANDTVSVAPVVEVEVVPLAEVAEPELLQPLETWQFAMVDEPQFELNADPLPVVTAAIENEAPAETELAETLRELARLDAKQSVVSESPSFEIELAAPDYFFEREKSIDTYNEDSSTSRLVGIIKSGTAAERTAAVRELAQLDEEQAFIKITELFDDASVDVRNIAALALFELKRDCAASFTRALREGSPERRSNIATAINGSGIAAQAIENLVGGSREKTYDAFSMLFLMARAGEVQLLLKTIESHPEVPVRLSVIKLLSFCNQPNIVPAFRSLAVRGTLPAEVRSAVMEAIHQIGNNARENSQSAA